MEGAAQVKAHVQWGTGAWLAAQGAHEEQPLALPAAQTHPSHGATQGTETLPSMCEPQTFLA